MKKYQPKTPDWTRALAALGLISLPWCAQAEEATQHQVATALASTTLSGYVDTSVIWQLGRGNIVLGRSFDGPSKQDGFNLNVIKLQLDKAPDEGKWSAGYTVGLLFGPDANTLSSLSAQSLAAGASDFAVKDAYITLRAPVGNGLDIKAGVFATVLGYEVLEAGNDPNYSRSWGYFVEPIIHTGVLATYKLNESLSISGGIADRGDINNINVRTGIESLKTYVASINYTAPESAGALKGTTVYAAVCDGNITPTSPLKASAGDASVLNWSAGATIPTPMTGLSVGVAYDYRASGLFNSSYENALGGYLLYKATDKLTFNNRAEYATGSRGAFGVFPGADETNARLFGNTFTADYALWGNAITRAEFRWDHSLTGQGLFNLGTSRNAVSLALNVIYKF